MTTHKARKRFGQHFLSDRSLVEKMVRQIAPADDQVMVEIGPGQGALTLPLLDCIQHLHVVELDRDLIEHLERTISGQRITIHRGDALRFDFTTLAKGPHSLRVVGNLPYNISTPLIFHLLDQLPVIHDMHFMLQKEVVDRLTATPGTPDWGRLSVMVQYHCRTEYLLFVPPGAFSPPPKVDSAVVRLAPHDEPPHIAHDYRLFRQMVSQAFTQRRKVIRNGVKSWLTEEQIAAAGVDPMKRPDALGVDAFVALANAATRQGD
ncbi:MAG: 16S rRNA (adenine(1518)-N(6)/adenine(1519)-N(6))-dimethyltransferase RsmA [Alcanivoracaceae bacterium]